MSNFHLAFDPSYCSNTCTHLWDSSLSVAERLHLLHVSISGEYLDCLTLIHNVCKSLLRIKGKVAAMKSGRPSPMTVDGSRVW